VNSVAPNPVTRQIGTTGVSVFPYAIDGSVFGWAAGYEATIEVLDAFHAAGGNLISTADHYAGGRSEVMIGSWLHRHHQRDRLVVATKIGRHPDAPGLSAQSIRWAVDACLERLRTPYIDVLSFDGADPDTPMEESLTAIAELMAAGKVRHLGFSGHPASQIVEALRVSARLGLPGPEALLAEYNLVERADYEKNLAPIAHEHGLGVLARLPLASGYLRGDFRTKDDRPTTSMFAGALKYVVRRGNKVLSALEAVSHEVDENIGRVALAWLLHRPDIAAVIVRAADGAALMDLLPSIELRLERHHIAALEKASS